MGNEIISMLIDGIEVQGKIIYRSPQDINVEITRPYKNLITGSHIPYFAMGVHNFKGEYGDKRALEFLKELYEIGKDIENILLIAKQRLLNSDEEAK